MKTKEQVETDVCFAYQEITGVYPESLATYHCTDDEMCASLRTTVMQALGISVPVTPQESLAFYAERLWKEIQLKNSPS